MILKFILLFGLVQSVLSESCVTFNFEDGFDSLFSRSRMCTTWGAPGDWTLGRYASTSVESPDELSSAFISPASPNTLSCTSSFNFSMSTGGEFEIHVYLEADLPSDGVNVFVNEIVANGNDGQVLTLLLNANRPEYHRGWHLLRGNLGGAGTFDGYVTIMGQASANSVLLIDAFRYIPASQDISADYDGENEECIIYKAEEIGSGESEETENPPEESEETDNQTEEPEEPDNNQTEEDGEPDNGSNQTEEPPDNGPNQTEEPPDNGPNQTEEPPNNGSNQTEEDGEPDNGSNQTEEPPDNGPNQTEDPPDNGSNQTEEDGEPDNGSNQTEEPPNNGSNQTEEDGEPDNGSNQTEEPPDNGPNQTEEPPDNGSNQTEEDGEPDNGSNQTEEPPDNGPNQTEEPPDNGSNQTEEDGEPDNGSNQTEEPPDNGPNQTEEPPDNGSNQTEEDGEPDNGSNQTEEPDNGSNQTEEPPDNGSNQTEEEGEETENGSNETEEIQVPDIQPDDNSVWNVLTITLTAVVSCILLSLICFACYQLGKRRAQDRIPLMYTDVEIPVPNLIPRITRVYPEPNIIHSI